MRTALADARAVAGALRDAYGFRVKLLTDATRADLINAFDEYRERLRERDNLLIYYAGHGWLDENSGRGYWFPVDAAENRRSNWLSNADVTDTLKSLLAKHVMVIADSCYSGTLTRGLKIEKRAPGHVERLARKKARTVLTSGGLEPVADAGGGSHSVFAKAFLEVLSENQDVIDGHTLFTRLRRSVMVNSDQTPEYGDIRKAGHDGGDFLFVRKR